MSNPIADLVREVEEMRRRMENMIRPSKVAQVRHSDGMVKIKSGKWTSDWLPWTELSGGIKTRNMPTVGQEVVGMFPSGGLEQGFVMPGQFTKSNGAPEASEGESIYTRGNMKMTIKDNDWMLSVGGATIRVRPNAINLALGSSEIVIVSGAISIKANLVLAQGAQLFHNTKNVGDTHTNAGLPVD